MAYSQGCLFSKHHSIQEGHPCLSYNQMGWIMLKKMALIANRELALPISCRLSLSCDDCMSKCVTNSYQ